MNQYEILAYALAYAYQRLSFASDAAAYDIELKRCLELKALMEKGRNPFSQVKESNEEVRR